MDQKSENTKRTSVYFPVDLYQRVQVSAERHRRTFNQEILWLIEQGFRVEMRIDLELSTRLHRGGEITVQDSEHWLPFEQARKFVRELGLKNSAEWQAYCKSGEKPADLPSVPEKTYKAEWKGYGDWLDIKWTKAALLTLLEGLRSCLGGLSESEIYTILQKNGALSALISITRMRSVHEVLKDLRSNNGQNIESAIKAAPEPIEEGPSDIPSKSPNA